MPLPSFQQRTLRLVRELHCIFELEQPNVAAADLPDLSHTRRSRNMPRTLKKQKVTRCANTRVRRPRGFRSYAQRSSETPDSINLRHLYLRVYVFLHVSVSMSASIYVCLSIGIHVKLHICVYLCVSLYMCMPRCACALYVHVIMCA